VFPPTTDRTAPRVRRLVREARPPSRGPDPPPGRGEAALAPWRCKERSTHIWLATPKSKRVADRARTGDRLDHNQELYQLSYSHHAAPNLPGWGRRHRPALRRWPEPSPAR